MSLEAQFLNAAGEVEFTAGAALASGQMIQMDDGKAAVVGGLEGFSSGDKATAYTTGTYRVVSASATTFSAGDEVWWDSSADLAITTPGEAADWYVGTALKAKASGDLSVDVEMNAPPNFKNGVCSSRVVLHDCETGVESASKTLIPAAWNQNGIVILGIYGIVAEQMAGASQDQGIITVSDTQSSPAALGTLTPSDGGADAIGDVIVGTGKILGGTTGDAVKTVAAGYGVTSAVTQATSGAGAAGKVKVLVLFSPLV